MVIFAIFICLIMFFILLTIYNLVGNRNYSYKKIEKYKNNDYSYSYIKYEFYNNYESNNNNKSNKNNNNNDKNIEEKNKDFYNNMMGTKNNSYGFLINLENNKVIMPYHQIKANITNAEILYYLNNQKIKIIDSLSLIEPIELKEYEKINLYNINNYEKFINKYEFPLDYNKKNFYLYQIFIDNQDNKFIWINKEIFDNPDNKFLEIIGGIDNYLEIKENYNNLLISQDELFDYIKKVINLKKSKIEFLGNQKLNNIKSSQSGLEYLKNLENDIDQLKNDINKKDDN